MKKLADILPKAHIQQITGDENIMVEGIELDSRNIKPGFLFAALSGTLVDGHNFIEKAIENGAVAVLCQKLPQEKVPGISYIQSNSPAKALSLIAAAFYNFPAQTFELVGVTGTNGKTTTATLLYQLFRLLGYKCGLVSTAGLKIENEALTTLHTTPNSISLQRVFAQMADKECDFVFMEVSSHAVVQDRIFGLPFRGGIFTNLTHDHLDYHGTLAAYRDAKKAFFDQLPSDAFALTNIDDKNGKFMVQNSPASRATYSIQNPADFKGKIQEMDLHGMLLALEGDEIYTRITGKFNAYNLLAVYAAALLLDMPKSKILKALSQLLPVEGRFQIIRNSNKTGVVDYAHTPDALQKILETIHEANMQGTKIITVVGCGGNRDRAKRPVMAKIAAELSDQVVLTSDNPRNERPEDILTDMESGIPPYKKNKVLTISDRKQAIRTACTIAQSGDIILVAGKGHETYQEINGVRHPFDDREILAEYLNESQS